MTVKITQKEIYDSIQRLRERNSEEHKNIIHRLDRTNGRVTLNRWIATTALSLSVIVVGLLIKS